MSAARTASGLVRACHPLPSAAVTAFGTLLGLAAGLGPGRAALLAAALLTGQLSIGWTNDAVDADKDRAAGRTDKPVVAGLVSAGTVRVAAYVALAVCAVLSLALGVLPGVLYLLSVASGWAYDLGLKGSRLSPLPYLVAFGLLPAVAATAAGVPVPWVLVAAAGLVGVAAHFANTVPDAEADAATGVRGLPQRVGPRTSRWVAAAGVVVACGLVLAAPGLPVVAVVLLLAGAALGIAGGAAPGAAAFRLVLAAAGAAVLGVLAAGPALLG